MCAGNSPGNVFSQLNPQEIPQEIIFRRKFRRNFTWIFFEVITFLHSSIQKNHFDLFDC
jgi:hypothetical protein